MGSRHWCFPGFPPLLQLSWEKRLSSNLLRCVAKSFTSFITVRHPFERLVSAYTGCFFASDSSEHELSKAANFRRRYGQDIIRKHRTEKIYVVMMNGKYVHKLPINRTEPQPSDSVYATAPTFQEFVSYLVATEVAKYNSHWLPIHLLCRPCSLSYTIL